MIGPPPQLMMVFCGALMGGGSASPSEGNYVGDTPQGTGCACCRMAEALKHVFFMLLYGGQDQRGAMWAEPPGRHVPPPLLCPYLADRPLLYGGIKSPVGYKREGAFVRR